MNECRVSYTKEIKMIKTRKLEMIDVDDWDDFIEKTYGRPYSFQQQDGCKERGIEYISVPCDPEDYKNDTVPEKVNNPEMGVSFKAWLERDPTQKLFNKDDQESYCLDLWWDRNFYPHVSMIINDLHSKGLLEVGEYGIDIDW
jgi:hypothetical protein